MHSDSGKTDSLWNLTTDVPADFVLEQDNHANVCVVGAGIAGMTTAYLAAREGKSVIVLDDGPIGGGETGRSTAHLTNALDDRYFEIENLHGEQSARLAAESHTAAINKIEEIVREENLDCDFERLNGYLFEPPGAGPETLDREIEAAHRAGLKQVKFLNRAPITAYDTGRCLFFPDQAQFHPLKYLSGLARAIVRDGGRICSRSVHVEKIEGGEKATITTRGGATVTASSVVVATNTPINDLLSIHTKQAAYRTYVIGALVPKDSILRALYWDTDHPYHSARLQSFSEVHDILIVGGENHKTGQAHDTNARFDRLEDWARQLFPTIELVEYRWSGQVMEPVDCLAFIGHNPGDKPNVYIATGDSGNGMTYGTIAGMLITDLMQGRDNPWAALYNPKRKTLRAAGEFAKVNLNVARQYAGYVTGGDVKSVDEIPPGFGAVIRRGLQKIAVYRDEESETFEMSAICPHLGCVVDWNRTEQTWDCPCHGSRFDAKGGVINGPANADLQPADDDEPETQPITAITE
jgi:glycine/D-amino acid oxidase-like deaminating enzyme/nitrite reductase/ring-hydroxylating ferredoxin subunit